MYDPNMTSLPPTPEPNPVSGNLGGGNLNMGPPLPGLNPGLIPDWFFNLGPGLNPRLLPRLHPGLNPRLIPDWFFNLGPGLKSIWVLDWSNLGPRLAIRVQSGTNPGPRLAIRDQSGTPQIASQIESWIDPRLIPDWFFNPGPPPGFKLPPPIYNHWHFQLCAAISQILCFHQFWPSLD